MNGKKLVIYSAVLMVVTAITTFILTTALNVAMFGFGINTVPKPEMDSKINKVAKIIEESYYLEPDKTKFADGAVSGLVASLNDPYSVYMTKTEYDQFNTIIEGSYSGIGISVTADKDDKRILVVAPIEGTPAEKAGIKSGDKILKVDGEDVSGEQLDAAVAKMKGKEGTAVSIDVLKADTGEVTTLNLIRENVQLKTVRSEVKDGNIGYVRITTFDQNTGKNFKNEIEQLKQKNIKGLILDLRGNPGGVVDAAQQVADVFLAEGQNVTYMEDRAGKREYVKASGDAYDIPLVVLIDGGSASASEIVSGALRDYQKAKLVGLKSFGKGLVQAPFRLDDGSYLKLTIARYFTPNGEDINKIGIKPDYEVKLPETDQKTMLTDSNDTQLQKALELLKAQ